MRSIRERFVAACIRLFRRHGRDFEATDYQGISCQRQIKSQSEEHYSIASGDNLAAVHTGGRFVDAIAVACAIGERRDADGDLATPTQ